MIGNSLLEYALIRTCISFFRYSALLNVLSLPIALAFKPSAHRKLLPLEIWAVAETVFYLTVYLPRKHILQRPADHPTTLSRGQRQKLFDLCHNNVPEPELYLREWFKGAPLAEIKRDNVKEFFCWAFLNKGAWGPDDEEELDGYADAMDSLLSKGLIPGRGTASALRLTLDNFNTQYRGLLWYFVVFLVDNFTHVHMLYHSFRIHRLELNRFFKVFPLRPLTIFTTHRAPGKTVSYWHRQHTSKTKLPVLFIHGIGIGLLPYVNFLAEINYSKEDDHGEIGVIAIEMMPISFRITHGALQKEEMCQEILGILKKHHWDEFVLVSHSYGSVISTHLLQHPEISPKIGRILLIDPVSILLHLPDVAFNFTCRKPRRANEHQLHYFGSMDMGVAHTLARRFFWSENILWKHDIEGRRVTVALSGQDLIVDTNTVGRYLTQDGPLSSHAQSSHAHCKWKQNDWKGDGLDVLWFQELDHAQAFDYKKARFALVDVVKSYCSRAIV